MAACIGKNYVYKTLDKYRPYNLLGFEWLMQSLADTRHVQMGIVMAKHAFLMPHSNCKKQPRQGSIWL